MGSGALPLRHTASCVDSALSSMCRGASPLPPPTRPYTLLPRPPLPQSARACPAHAARLFLAAAALSRRRQPQALMWTAPRHCELNCGGSLSRAPVRELGLATHVAAILRARASLSCSAVLLYSPWRSVLLFRAPWPHTRNLMTQPRTTYPSRNEAGTARERRGNGTGTTLERRGTTPSLAHTGA